MYNIWFNLQMNYRPTSPLILETIFGLHKTIWAYQ